MNLALERPLSQNLKEDGSVTGLQEFRDRGGYTGLQNALKLESGQVMIQIKESNLRGRGGAGFNTGLKWSFVPKSNEQKYLIANADEMEPGTFKDRWLMEGDPHQLIEGMIISAYALGATIGYIFLRADYPIAAERLEQALADAYQNNLLGKNIQGTSFSMDIYLHTSAGRYICGEETALISSLEGKRANPRGKSVV